MSFHANLVNDWELSKRDQSSCDSYYLLHWSVMHLFKKLQDADGVIEHNGTVFIPVFKSESFTLDTKAQVMLSFRVPRDEGYELPNYVLIKAM